jgi:hypothetical protein
VARWVIQKEVAWTFCEEAHPVRLGRNPQHYQGESMDRKLAIDLGKKGYLCQGDQHPYDLWVVFDADDDRKENAGVFDTYAEAKMCRDGLAQQRSG